MRVNTSKAIEAFKAGKYSKAMCGSIWSNGNAIYSYKTCLLVRDKTGELVLNVTKYSSTTSNKQSSLRMTFPEAFQVDNVRIGSDSSDLIRIKGLSAI